MEPADGSYRGDGPTWGEAGGLCGRTYGPTTAVVVPSRADWFANGERTAVCLERVDA